MPTTEEQDKSEGLLQMYVGAKDPHDLIRKVLEVLVFGPELTLFVTYVASQRGGLK